MEVEQINFIMEPEQINMKNIITHCVITAGVQTNSFSSSFANVRFLVNHMGNFKSSVKKEMTKK